MIYTELIKDIWPILLKRLELQIKLKKCVVIKPLDFVVALKI